MGLSREGYALREILAEQGYEFTPDEIDESVDIALEIHSLKESEGNNAENK